MRRKNQATISLLTTTLLFTLLSVYVYRNFISAPRIHFPRATFKDSSSTHHHNLNYLLHEDHHLTLRNINVSSLKDSSSLDSILLPDDWQILLVSPPDSTYSDDQYSCLFQNNAISPAKFAGLLQFTNRKTFKCSVPNSIRSRRPLISPILIKSKETWPENRPNSPEMMRWHYLAYESLSTEKDVILFVKGVNNRRGENRLPKQLTCVFDNGVNNYSVKTAVTSSSQEVFRCYHPNETEIKRLFQNGDEKIKISLEIQGEKRDIVPSITYYTPKLKVEFEERKSLICACTMVHNVGKFLKEWVIYHSKLGVDKFMLYDNDSDDNLKKVVEELVEEQYDVKTFLWPWPKTQEAGFSHSAIFGKDSCTWMMYMDVDEFVFSPSWLNASKPSHNMLSSFLPAPPSLMVLDDKLDWYSRPIGQIMIRCLEYGPSNQQSHPIAGVTQGYTCRRKIEQRHKSIVLLDAIDDILHNAIHHFRIKEEYTSKTLSLDQAAVNHYKYQAWSEFKVKFRRRVSAYVVDWGREVNPMSKDRTPGLGFEAIEPEGWANQFCEVNDNRLKIATQRWFSSDASAGSEMAWQD